jgi:hypothetical protein
MYTTITISIVYIIFYRPEMIIKEDDNYVYYSDYNSNMKKLLGMITTIIFSLLSAIIMNQRTLKPAFAYQRIKK